MLRNTIFLFVFVVAASVFGAEKLRAPAYPLIAHDPYFSVWSFADKLTDVPTTHWTGKPQPINGTIVIDGDTQIFRFMGTEPKECPAMPQTDVTVTPTRTIYNFATDKVKLTVTFLTPALPDDIDLLSRPLTYMCLQISSADGRQHHAILDITVDAHIAANTPEQEIVCDEVKIPLISVLRAGSKDQNILGKKGDDLRIDWGHFYLAVPQGQFKASGIGAFLSSTNGKETLEATIDAEISQDGQPLEYTLMFVYDDIKSIRYFNKGLLPYWKRNGATVDDLITQSVKNIRKIRERCEKFDAELIDNLTKTGGEKYAQLCTLIYRQTWAANKIVCGPDKRPYMFSKENFSNGCIGTVDVLYPHTPFLLFFSPALLKASLVPVLNYAESDHWKYDYAPHDIGTYPLATGQVYGMGGGDGNRMPVEESGNMLIIIGALAKIEGNADFSVPYWDLLTKWADYLVKEGYDPENQLCSADMFGHLAHVTNLSLKAILGIGAYAQLCEKLGKKEDAAKYRKIAEEYAAKWLKDAADEGRTRLAFDKPGTWSMKHNLVWDSILETNLFPASLAGQEIAWYKKVQNRYGLPVDSRTDNSLIDWVLWSITPAKSKADFDELFAPIYNYVNETPSRVPLSDWFFTTNAKQRGFQARSVVGGVYIKMLTDKAVWKKYAHQAENVSEFPSLYPIGTIVTEIVPTARQRQTDWKYTLEPPPENWTQPNFDDSAWKTGKGGFGTAVPGNPPVGTAWNTKEIWLRKELELTTVPDDKMFLYVYYDEDPEIWINGVFAVKIKGYSANYSTLEISPEAKKAIKTGKNVLAVKASQTYGGQYIDVGLAKESAK